MNKKLGVFIAVLAVGVFAVIGFSLYQTKLAGTIQDAAWENANDLVRPHSSTLGAANAPFTLVEFFDPACGACRAFYPHVKNSLKKHEGHLRLVLRYAAFHKDSDKVVRILEATRRQGLYWQSLEAALASQDAWSSHGNPDSNYALLWPYLEKVGVNVSQVKVDMEREEIQNVLKIDTADTNKLQIAQTPTFFLNGKLLELTSLEAFESEIDKRIAMGVK